MLNLKNQIIKPKVEVNSTVNNLPVVFEFDEPTLKMVLIQELAQDDKNILQDLPRACFKDKYNILIKSFSEEDIITLSVMYIGTYLSSREFAKGENGGNNNFNIDKDFNSIYASFLNEYNINIYDEMDTMPYSRFYQLMVNLSSDAAIYRRIQNKKEYVNPLIGVNVFDGMCF